MFGVLRWLFKFVVLVVVGRLLVIGLVLFAILIGCGLLIPGV